MGFVPTKWGFLAKHGEANQQKRALPGFCRAFGHELAPFWGFRGRAGLVSGLCGKTLGRKFVIIRNSRINI